MTGPELFDLQMKGYFPGVVGKITQLHATYYHEHWGLDVSFETQVGRELSEFIGRFREDRDGFRVAVLNGEFAGSIAIDGGPEGDEGVRLRWFIVDPVYQGRGIGRALMKEAIRFCRERDYGKLHLWTFRGLEAARLIYEETGFRLCLENDVYQWGQNIKEQKYEMIL
jgi:GNAT superfamily N-acetyltransferase